MRPVKAGPVQAFAAELRALRRRCGTPDFPSISRTTGASVDALAAAVAGEQLPTWPTVAAFVRGCGGRVADWRQRWEQARACLLVRIPAPRMPS
ncbi:MULTISPECIES: hypothetical protein [Actinokineospora]|uniref:XRE family transcriptional regulator n=1 Tax=Actinokineospora fastidiosa TaxID=1816 RepID=A0A918G7S1_9PSEU|nr:MULTISPECIES: hypothetical protein [Actinokineospora]UVS82276.1 hypothetical protein Actkin_06045 [Actinokineospora sp. UTMC 2448]GGS22387.1 hypothetical protein GCM10010171_14020 [Actinokineospora fastidiosa]